LNSPYHNSDNEHSSWQTPFVVCYSGDTRPSPRLVDACYQCGIPINLLIHEATFADDEINQAKKKRHSTVGEAIGVARQIQSQACLLTHFSQRYPCTPPDITKNLSQTTDSLAVGFAVDGLILPLTLEMMKCLNILNRCIVKLLT
jgi:ribonuclease BN (tRNA processing enzyme)